MFGEWFSQISPRRWQAGKVLFLKGALPSLFQLSFFARCQKWALWWRITRLFILGGCNFLTTKIVWYYQKQKMSPTKKNRCLCCDWKRNTVAEKNIETEHWSYFKSHEVDPCWWSKRSFGQCNQLLFWSTRRTQMQNTNWALNDSKKVFWQHFQGTKVEKGQQSR